MSTTLPTIPAWIARTKLHPPRLPADAIERPRLLEALNLAVTSTSVTLISAPAGSGKTTLLATWLASRSSELSEPEQTQNFKVAWLALDEGDDDPASFLLALVAALGQLNPDSGASLLQWLASGPAPSAEPRRFAGVLVNEIMQTLPEPFVLVLDDLHALAAPPIFTFLDHMIERMPPHMHMVVATRHEPPVFEFALACTFIGVGVVVRLMSGATPLPAACDGVSFGYGTAALTRRCPAPAT